MDVQHAWEAIEASGEYSHQERVKHAKRKESAPARYADVTHGCGGSGPDTSGTIQVCNAEPCLAPHRTERSGASRTVIHAAGRAGCRCSQPQSEELQG